jgi:hypothetical protein
MMLKFFDDDEALRYTANPPVGLIFGNLSFKVNEFGYQRLPYRAVGCAKV